MLAGYTLNRYKMAPSFITPFINFILWVLSLLMLLLLVFGVWNGTLDRAWTALYVSVGHTGNNFIIFIAKFYSKFPKPNTAFQKVFKLLNYIFIKTLLKITNKYI